MAPIDESDIKAVDIAKRLPLAMGQCVDVVIKYKEHFGEVILPSADGTTPVEEPEMPNEVAMMQWALRDRYHNDIYLTEERWLHILDGHDELTDRLDDVLDTIKLGQRTQDALEPQKYRYYRAYDDLMYGFNHIVVVVLFKISADGLSNNFIVTAWGAYIHSKS